MSCGNELHSPLCHGAGGKGLSFGANLVNDNHFWHVILHSFHHDAVLQAPSPMWHLDTACWPYSSVWDVPIPPYLVAVRIQYKFIPLLTHQRLPLSTFIDITVSN